MTQITVDLAEKRDRLLARIERLGSCAVALSGGVDSAVVAKAASLALGDRAIAVTAESPSLPAGELDVARHVAGLVGIRHEVVHTREIDNARYRRNAPDRCYHCKDELYTTLEFEWVRPLGVSHVLGGANADDASDYRPGMTAAAEHGVLSPLVECGITKDEVRALARHWGLPIADKPASPCLSSRIEYGEEVTPERLRMIDQAETWLRSRGFSQLRVRLLRGDVARVEVPEPEIGRLLEATLRSELIGVMRDLGFSRVTVDLEGFRSGSMNDFIPAAQLAGGR